MKYIKTLALCGVAGLSVSGQTVQAGGSDDPLLTKVIIDQLESRAGDGSNPAVLEAQAWVGYDLHKLWIKTDLEKVGSEFEEVELQALYSKAVHPYWDFQTGWRHDSKPKPSRDWFAIGFQGVAPYWIETDAALFLADDGLVNARVTLEQELMLTQKLVLMPEFEVNLYSKADNQTDIGSGLSDTIFSLRVGYELRREFTPYVGVNWQRKYGGSADHAREAGEPVSDTRLLVGIKAWF